MTTTTITTPVFQPQPKVSPEEAKTMNMLPQLNGLNTNLTNSNKWYAYFPIESILGRKYNGIELHLVRFSLPQMEMSSTEVSYKGYTKSHILEMSTGRTTKRCIFGCHQLAET